MENLLRIPLFDSYPFPGMACCLAGMVYERRVFRLFFLLIASKYAGAPFEGGIRGDESARAANQGRSTSDQCGGIDRFDAGHDRCEGQRDAKGYNRWQREACRKTPKQESSGQGAINRAQGQECCESKPEEEQKQKNCAARPKSPREGSLPQTRPSPLVGAEGLERFHRPRLDERSSEQRLAAIRGRGHLLASA